MSVFSLVSCVFHALGMQRRVLRVWLQAQKRANSAAADATQSRLQELCEAEGCRLEDSDEDEEEEELQNSEPLDSDIQLSDSGTENNNDNIHEDGSKAIMITNVLLICTVLCCFLGR